VQMLSLSCCRSRDAAHDLWGGRESLRAVVSRSRHSREQSCGEVSNAVKSKLLLDDSGAMIAASAAERRTLLTLFRRNRIKCQKREQHGQCIIRFEQPYDIRRIDVLFEAWRKRAAC
jgi:hypothetical protein